MKHINILRYGIRNRKGLSSVVGTVFFIIVFTSVASYIIYSMNQIDQFGQAVIGKSQDNINKNNEAFEITSITKDNNKFNITLQNTGQLPVNITRLWIQNKTDPTFPVSKFTINQIIAPGQTLTKVGQNIKLTALPSQAYDISLVTERGNVEEALVNSASRQPLYLQLFVLPDKVSAAFSTTTILFAVTNNMSNNGMLTNLAPHLDVANPVGSTLTLVSGKPSNYTILKNGNTAFFKWVYNISGNVGQKINFTASLQNGYLNNYAIGNVTVVAPYAGFITNTIKKTSAYTATATDDVIDVDATNANPTIINLPDATTNKGKIFFIKKDDTSGNTLMIDPSGSQTIDGLLLNLNLTNNKDTAILQSNGANYIRLDRVADDENSYRTSGTTMNRWYGTAFTQDPSDTILWTGNVLRAYPFVVPKTITTDQIQTEVSTAANPTSTICRMGIYTDNGNQYPFKLVGGSDVSTFTTTAAVKTNPFASSITLYSGLYWLALDCQPAGTTQPTFRGVSVSAVPNILGYASGMGANQAGTGWTVNFNFAALPATYPSGGTILTNSVPPMILVRLVG